MIAVPPFVQAVLWVVGAGSLGGLVPSLLAGDIVLPTIKKQDSGYILIPGVLTNSLIGSIAALISFGLNDSFANYVVVGAQSVPITGTVTLNALMGAMLIGTVGSRWLTSEAEARLFKSTTSLAVQNSQSANKDKIQAALAEGSALKTYELMITK